MIGIDGGEYPSAFALMNAAFKASSLAKNSWHERLRRTSVKVRGACSSQRRGRSAERIQTSNSAVLSQAEHHHVARYAMSKPQHSDICRTRRSSAGQDSGLSNIPGHCANGVRSISVPMKDGANALLQCSSQRSGRPRRISQRD